MAGLHCRSALGRLPRPACLHPARPDMIKLSSSSLSQEQMCRLPAVFLQANVGLSLLVLQEQSEALEVNLQASLYLFI